MRQQHAVRPQGHTPEIDRPGLPQGGSGPFCGNRSGMTPRTSSRIPCMLALTSPSRHRPCPALPTPPPAALRSHDAAR
ncbi:hypothetical protein CNECB9_1390006 [Cupriavidus necator]|uniref:Uncharacterized protein n=1 Tax=Cupriavidus necator TaxID=106590 RepID=A0A1K0IAP8_CUPNE|nr:hypothetical protein CNECB9_1390006 [Cupriavidus necator]